MLPQNEIETHVCVPEPQWENLTTPYNQLKHYSNFS